MARVLIVEDDLDSAEPLARYLRKLGYQVDSRRNGKEALSVILADKPDLVVLDMYMPDMDGPSLLEVLRSYLRLQSLPVIVWTGLSDSPMVERARHLKVNCILVKGKATLEEVAQAVQQELPRLPS